MAIMEGRKSYATFFAEATWGTRPATPVYYHIPVDPYGVVMNRETRNADPFIGILGQKHNKSFRGMPSGQIVTCPYGYKPNSNALSIMQYLVDWGISEPQTIEKLSKGVDWAEGPDVSNKTHLGLRVNSLTLEGSADSGRVLLTLDVMGKTEVALVTAQTLVDDREGIIEPEFSDVTAALGGSAISIGSFRYTVANNLTPTYLNGTSPAHLTAGQLVETLEFEIIKTADTYSALQRAFAESEVTGQLVIKSPHNGTGSTGTYTVLTIDFGRLAFLNPADSAQKALLRQRLSFKPLKPDSSTATKVLTYSET